MRKKMTIILLIELLILIIVSLFLYIEAKDNKNKYIEIPIDACYSDYIELNDGRWSVRAGELSIEEDIILVTTPEIHLDKGFYSIELDYACTYGQYVSPTAKQRNNQFIKANKYLLEKNYNHESYVFELTEDIENFRLDIEYNGVGDFEIYGINIKASDCTQKMKLLRIFLIIMLFNSIFILHNVSKEKRNEVLTVFIISMLCSLPLFYKGVDGHDIAFHLMRIDGLVNELRCGKFPVYISSAWMGGYGYPTSIYYGDILLYFPAILRLFGVNVTLAYKIFVFFVNLLTTIVSVISFKRIFKDIRLAQFLSLVYVASSYRLVDIYVRAAVGEYTAAIFFPIIAYAVWGIYNDNVGFKKNCYNGTILALGMTGIITSHVLTTEMTVVALLIIVVLLLDKLFIIDTIRGYSIGVLLTVLMSSFFTVPFLDYYKNVSVLIQTNALDAVSSKIQEDGITIADLFSFFNNPFGSPGYMLCIPGIALIIAFLIGCILCMNGEANRRIRVLTISSAIILLLSSNIFPWNSLAYNYKIFNLLAQVQFPWRYIIIASVFLTVLLGEEIKYYKDNSNYNVNRILKTLTLITVSVTCLFISYYSDYAARNMYYDLNNLKLYGVSGGEYLRIRQEGEEIIVSESDYFDGKIKSETINNIDVIYRNGTDFDVSCINETGKDGIIEFPIINYKGYVAYDDKGKNYTIEDSEICLVQVRIADGFVGNLHIRFVPPWYWKIAAVTSFLTFALVIFYLVFCEIRSNKYRI